MAMVVMDQQQPQPQTQTYKYYCRICNKGFGCGRALGGHMRAHGINDDPSGTHADPDDDPSDWAPSNKRSYALRTNPNRFKSCRACENCGREFVSWKAFLEHGKCSSDDDDVDADDDEAYELLTSSPRSDAEEDGVRRSCAGWSKGKRSRRAKSAAVTTSICPTSEEEDLANCLVMLSSARVDPMIIVEPEELCASASKEEDRRYHPIVSASKSKGPALAPLVPKGMFECKACKKVFTSHQALGGHRASHKKVKGCFAAKPDDVLDDAPPEENVTNQEAAAAMTMAIVPFDNAPIAVVPLKKKSKVHECSICHRQFASGQALGGHKRCHWITSNPPDPSSIGKLQQLPDPPNHHRHDLMLRPMFDPSEPIDLNMPVSPVDGLTALRQELGSPLRLEVPAAMYLQPWVDDHKDKATVTSSNNNNPNNNMINNYNNGDDEVDSKVKLAKLSELKDMNAGGEASPWLQVGIGSSGNEGSEK